MSFEKWIVSKESSIKSLESKLGPVEMQQRSYEDESPISAKSVQSNMDLRGLLKEAYYAGRDEKPKPRFKDLPHRSIYNR